MRQPLGVPNLVHLARQLRSDQTQAEEVLWAMLRRRQLLNQKFRRQQQIGTFIVDFYCHQARLVIEVDGAIHNIPEQADRDRNREAFFEENRLQVLRFTNQQILEDPETVLHTIARAVHP